MDPTAIVIVGIVAASLIALVAMASHRSWNADGSDDARREDRDEGASLD